MLLSKKQQKVLAWLNVISIFAQALAMVLVILFNKLGALSTPAIIAVIACAWTAIGTLVATWEIHRRNNVGMTAGTWSAFEFQWLAFIAVVAIFGPLNGKVSADVVPGLLLIGSLWLIASVTALIRSRRLVPEADPIC